MRKHLIAVLGALFMCFHFAWAQEAEVSGRVTDDKGNSLQGASVTEKGTKKGTVTGTDGTFKLMVQRNSTLEVSSVGYEKKTLAIGNGGSFTIALSQENQSLTEVVVTAVGITRSSKSLGYSVSKVSGEELTKAREPNLINSLAGKISGVRVTSSSGTVGGASKIVIRGTSSLQGSPQPLFVIDGLPLDNSTGNSFGNGAIDFGNRVADINPDDVETMTVLKGAAATALYGSRAKNGAIVITTKKGSRRSAAIVTVNSSIRMDRVLKLPEFQNDYANGNYGVYNMRFVNGWGPKISDVQNLTFKDFKGDDVTLQSYPDNVKNFYETGMTYINTVGIAGGSENTDYRLSFGNTTQNGVVPGSKLGRYNLNFNAGRTFNEKFSARATLTYARTTAEGRPVQSSNDFNVLANAVLFPRTLNQEKLKNNYFNPLTGEQYSLSSDKTSNNPYWIINKNKNNTEVDRVVGNTVLSYKPFPWMTISNNLGTDFFNEYRRTVTVKGTYGQLDGGFSLAQIYNSSINNDLLVTIEKSNILKDLDLKFIAGHNYFQATTRTLGVTALGLTVDGLYSLGNASTKDPVNGYARSRLVGAFGDIGLSYKNYLYLNITGRNDWNSTLPISNRSYFYPSVSTSFIFTELLKPSKILSYGKIRAGWANVGSGASPYSLDFLYTPATSYFVQYGLNGTFPTAGGLLGFSGPRTLPNVNLKPQNQQSIELGTELSFFKGRIQLDATYYNTKTTDQILSIDVPLSTGYFAKNINAGSITNKGFEIDLRTQVVKNWNGFSWNVDFNFNRNKQVVNELDGQLKSYSLVSGYSGLVVKASVGETFGLWGTDWRRSPNGDIIINQSTGLREVETDKRLGNIFPDWTMGINNSFSYKNFTLSGLIDIRQGGVLYSGTVSGMRTSGLAIETLPNRGNVFVDNGVYLNTADGKYLPNTIPVQSMQDYWVNNFKTSNTVANVFDASYVKLREIRFSYVLPSFKGKRMFFKSAEVGVEARNLLIIKDFVPHIDPEVNIFGPNQVGEGLEFYNVPSTRSIGVNVRFTL
jgi:TonB-linked SusC/RagA family outer membrane protein